MKYFNLQTLVRSRRLVMLASTLVIGGSTSFAASFSGKSFATPEAAVSALAEALQTTNRVALREIFGPSADDLVNPDPVQAANEFAAFSAALSETNRLIRESETRCRLEVGAHSFSFPVPLVRQDGGWLFDTAAGHEEVRNRRIGRNELSTLETMRAYVAAPAAKIKTYDPDSTWQVTRD